MDDHYFELFFAVVLPIILAVIFVLSAFFAPCHGGAFDFNKGQFCEECGQPRYHVCACGHRLNGTYCTYCGAKNEFLED